MTSAGRRALWLLAPWLLALPQTAFAHLVSTRFGELYGGMLHPLLSLLHLVPLLGLSLLGGLQTAPIARAAPWVLPVAAAIGAISGAFGPELLSVTYVNLCSFVVIGLAVAFSMEFNSSVPFTTLLVLFGLSHGYENAAPELTGMDRFLYVCGVTLSVHALTTLGTAGAQWLRGRAGWGKIAVRAAGSWIVAIGLIFGGFTLLTAS